MKFIIIGLGNFGAWLGENLTTSGHEVIGVDLSMHKVDAMKDRITHVIRMDTTDIQALTTLPLKDSDAVIVAIGEDVGASIMTTALLKQLKVKRIIGRVISPLHETVISAIGIDEVVHPEQETAERWSKKLDLKGVVESFNITGNYHIIEIKTPLKYVEKTIGDCEIKEKYGLNIITILRSESKESIFGFEKTVKNAVGVVNGVTKIQGDDILVVFGHIRDLKQFMEDNA